jgi:hypothetical protein
MWKTNIQINQESHPKANFKDIHFNLFSEAILQNIAYCWLIEDKHAQKSLLTTKTKTQNRGENIFINFYNIGNSYQGHSVWQKLSILKPNIVIRQVCQKPIFKKDQNSFFNRNFAITQILIFEKNLTFQNIPAKKRAANAKNPKFEF